MTKLKLSEKIDALHILPSLPPEIVAEARALEERVQAAETLLDAVMAVCVSRLPDYSEGHPLDEVYNLLTAALSEREKKARGEGG